MCFVCTFFSIENKLYIFEKREKYYKFKCGEKRDLNTWLASHVGSLSLLNLKDIKNAILIDLFRLKFIFYENMKKEHLKFFFRVKRNFFSFISLIYRI